MKEITIDVKQRFIKDMNLKIQCVQEPYFSYLIDLYDRDFGTKEKYGMLLRTVGYFGSGEAFLNSYYELRDRVIAETKKLREYDDFLDADMSVYEIVQPELPNAHRTDVYNPQNVGQDFISLDMKKANYQVMRRFSKDLVFGTDTYEEYIGRFTDMEYLKMSKYTRQVIFGSMSPKRQTAIQRSCMRQVFDFLLKEYGVPLEAFAVFTFDEIVLRRGLLGRDTADRLIREAGREILDGMDIDVRVKPFTLRSVGGRNFYVNEMEDGSVEFKKVPSIIFPQVYKKYRGLPLEKRDMVFFHEGYLASFEEPVFAEDAPVPAGKVTA